jgi:hypothetical protein
MMHQMRLRQAAKKKGIIVEENDVDISDDVNEVDYL